MITALSLLLYASLLVINKGYIRLSALAAKEWLERTSTPSRRVDFYRAQKYSQTSERRLCNYILRIYLIYYREKA